MSNCNKMIVRYQEVISNPQKFALISSLIIVISTFSVFIAQYIFVKSYAFQSEGDSLALTFAAVFKLAEMISNFSLWGIDLDSFNGATEFMLRSNITTHYLPIFLLAMAVGHVNFSVARILLLLFYAVHLFISVYYGQRLGGKYFHLGKWLSLLLVVSFLGPLYCAMWYMGFYILSALFFPWVRCIMKLNS